MRRELKRERHANERLQSKYDALASWVIVSANEDQSSATLLDKLRETLCETLDVEKATIFLVYHEQQELRDAHRYAPFCSGWLTLGAGGQKTSVPLCNLVVMSLEFVPRLSA